MDNVLNMGGFPPLVKKEKKIKGSETQKQLKEQYFSNNKKETINIREILNEKTSLSVIEKEDELVEVDEV